MERGKERTSLPPESWVMRAVEARLYASQPINRTDFEGGFILSNDDEVEIPPSLSVYAEDLTTPEQLYQLTGKSSFVRLSVGNIRGITWIDEPSSHRSLDVVWTYARNVDGSHDTRPGTDGHAGIIGIPISDNKTGKNRRKSIRQRLVEIIDKDFVKPL
jgi:hypothetical protein